MSWVPWSGFAPELQFSDPAEALRPLNQRPGHGGPGNQVHAAGGFAPAAAARTREELEADPLVRTVIELFEARPIHLEFDDDASRLSSA